MSTYPWGSTATARRWRTGSSRARATVTSAVSRNPPPALIVGARRGVPRPQKRSSWHLTVKTRSTSTVA